MSADLLREAAKLMRERAEGATPGPWTMRDGWGPTDDGLMVFARIANDAHETVIAPSGHPDGPDGLEAKRYDAEHIAYWHPAVALAVADWLEAEAKSEAWPSPHSAAVAVARTYLGEPS